MNRKIEKSTTHRSDGWGWRCTNLMYVYCCLPTGTIQVYKKMTLEQNVQIKAKELGFTNICITTYTFSRNKTVHAKISMQVLIPEIYGHLVNMIQYTSLVPISLCFFPFPTFSLFLHLHILIIIYFHKLIATLIVLINKLLLITTRTIIRQIKS